MAEEKQPAAADTSAAEAAAADATYRKQLAEMVTGISDEAGTEEKKPEEPEKKPEEPKPEDEEAKEDEADKTEDGDPDEEDTQASGDKEQGKYSKAFRELQKRESSIQQMKHEVLQREQQIYKAHQEVERREQELVAFIQELRAKPHITLLKHGLITEQELEYASKQLWYMSPAAQADPKTRAEAERLMREQSLLLESQKTRQEVENLKRQQEYERQQAQLLQAREVYSTKLEATVEQYKQKTPLLAAALQKNPQRTLQEIYEKAAELSAAKKAFADPALVVLAWTKARKQLLSDHGVAEPVATKEQEKSKTAAEKKGPPNGKSSKAAQDSSQLTDEEKDAKYRKQLAAMLRGEAVED